MSNNNTSSAFGSSFGAGSLTQNLQGSTVPFNEYTEKDNSPSASGIMTTLRFQSISAMPQYITKSFEEIRYEDYKQNRRYGTGSTSSGFGTTNSTSTGGFGSAFGSKNTTSNTGFGSIGFGSTNNTSSPFGQNSSAFGSNNTSNNAFGSSTSAFGSNNSSSPFSSNNNTTSNAFGSSFGTNNPPFGQNNAPNKPLFGGGNAFGSSNTNTSGGLFGSNNNINSSSLFGQSNNTSAFGFNNNNTNNTNNTGGGFGGFGANKFGSNTTSTFGQNNNTGSSLFGQTNNAPSTGTGLFGNNNPNTSNTGSMFGQNNNNTTGGGLFGSKPPAATVGLFGNNNPSNISGGGLFGGNTTSNAFGSNTNTSTATGGLFGQKPTATTGGLFGSNNSINTGSTGTGLFGNNNNTNTGGGLFGAKPAGTTTTGFGSASSGGGLFGNNNTNAANTTSTTGGLFGNNNGTKSLFGGANTTATSATSGGTGLFGAALGANNNNQQQQNTSFGGGLFGQNQNKGNTAIQPQSNGLVASVEQNPYGLNPLFSSEFAAVINSTPAPVPVAIPLTGSARPKKHALLSASKLTPKPLFSLARRATPKPSINTPSPKLLTGTSSAKSTSPNSRSASVIGASGSSGTTNGSFYGSNADDVLLASHAFSPQKSVRRLILERKRAASRIFEDGYDEETDNTTKSNVEEPKALEHEKDLDVSKPEITANGSAAAASSVKTNGDKSLCTNDSSESSFSAVSEPLSESSSVDNQANNKVELTSALPVADNDDVDENGYWMSPRAAELEKLSLQDLRAVKNFVVGRRGYGKIEFLDAVDLSKFKNLAGEIFGKVVLFVPRSCSLYSDAAGEKPAPGKGLNVQTRVSIEGVWPLSRATREPIKDLSAKASAKHIEKLKSVLGGNFVSFDKETGTFVFENDPLK
jgi:nuclear pore complex protein Nup98-Nup96